METERQQTCPLEARNHILGSSRTSIGPVWSLLVAVGVRDHGDGDLVEDVGQAETPLVQSSPPGHLKRVEKIFQVRNNLIISIYLPNKSSFKMRYVALSSSFILSLMIMFISCDKVCPIIDQKTDFW